MPELQPLACGWSSAARLLPLSTAACPSPLHVLHLLRTLGSCSLSEHHNAVRCCAGHLLQACQERADRSRRTTASPLNNMSKGICFSLCKHGKQHRPSGHPRMHVQVHTCCSSLLLVLAESTLPQTREDLQP